MKYCSALTLLLSICLAGNAASALAQTPAPSYAPGYFDRLPCVDRIGRCFDATVGGHTVEVIADKAEYERLRTELQRLNRNVRETYWIVRSPVSGDKALDVITRPNAVGLPHVGEEREEPDVTVYALDGQDLPSETEVVANESVRVNGQPVLTRQETLTEDFLPPGRYAFAIKYLGRKNWDRKWVFLTVGPNP